jgi:rhodanese-related sulfurtransferase
MNELEINCQGLKKLLDEKAAFSLIDCRYQDEFEICRINGANLIPLPEFPSAFDEIEVEPELQIIVYCHHGVRSLNAVAYLRKLGFKKALSLKGGIDRWSTEIDPSIPRY